MVLKINTEISNYIRESENDESIKNFLLEAYFLEFRRNREESFKFFEKYDKIVSIYYKK
ncbi:MAG: hypothetical protein ACRCVG_00675 [Methanobacteriaceae archaeon]